MRIAMKTHKYVKIKKGDTIVLSSSIVPGNERAVQKLKDNLSAAKAHASSTATRWMCTPPATPTATKLFGYTKK